VTGWIVTVGHIETSKVALTLAHFFASGVERTALLARACFQIDRRRKVDRP
jgi:hypothetical protein